MPTFSLNILQDTLPHLKEWCGEHMWAPGCFHGRVGNGWEVVSEYIETQDVHQLKTPATGHELKSGEIAVTYIQALYIVRGLGDLLRWFSCIYKNILKQKSIKVDHGNLTRKCCAAAFNNLGIYLMIGYRKAES